MNRDKVRDLQQPVEAHAFDAGGRKRLLRHVGVMGDDAQPERFCLGRERARDVAEADEAEHASGQTVDRNDSRHFPAAGLHQRVGERDLARERKEQRHGMVRHLVHAIVRHIGHGDAELRRRLDVDIVDAQAEAADRLAARELAQQLAGKLRVGDEHGVGIARHRQNVLGCRALRHAQLGVDTRERRLRRIERGKRAVGDGDYEAGHEALHTRNVITLATPLDSRNWAASCPRATRGCCRPRYSPSVREPPPRRCRGAGSRPHWTF